MSKPQTVELYTTDGDLVIYRPLAARLPEFLARFGPERGFAVRTEIADLLSFRPGLLRLCEVAAREGRKAEDLGLPPLAQAAGLMVCRAALEDANGRVLATATAAKEVRAHKDLEALETAARQRLLAAVEELRGPRLELLEAMPPSDSGPCHPIHGNQTAEEAGHEEAGEDHADDCRHQDEPDQRGSTEQCDSDENQQCASNEPSPQVFRVARRLVHLGEERFQLGMSSGEVIELSLIHI